jgi:hypothetical protein
MGIITKEEVEAIATPLIRKYDWHVEDIENGVRLTVTDNQENASVDITTDENIKSEINRLIEQVDNHNYTVIG